MSEKIIQNDEANVQNQNLIYATRNEVVGNATQTIFEEMIALEQVKILSEIITTEITAELMHASFMTEQLELTEKQKEKMLSAINAIVEKSRNSYLAKIKKDERTKKVADLVEWNLISILEEMLSGLAKEVNRGALINCVAVAADTKSEKHNKIELNAMKSAGDITILTRCLLVSTNCLELIKNSVEQQLEPIKNENNQE